MRGQAYVPVRRSDPYDTERRRHHHKQASARGNGQISKDIISYSLHFVVTVMTGGFASPQFRGIHRPQEPSQFQFQTVHPNAAVQLSIPFASPCSPIFIRTSIAKGKKKRNGKRKEATSSLFYTLRNPCGPRLRRSFDHKTNRSCDHQKLQRQATIRPRVNAMPIPSQV